MSQPIPPPPQQPPTWGPPQHPAWAPQPAGPPRRSTGRIVGITIACVASLAVVGSCIASLNKDEGPGALGDVQITDCRAAALTGWPYAELEITNHSSVTSSYTMQVEFLDAGGVRYGDGFASTLRLPPGRSAAEKAQGFTRVPDGGQCRVVKVTRTASR